MKVLGAEGKKVLPNDRGSSQDFLFNNSPILPFGHVRSYLEMARVLAESDGTPEGTARAFAAKKAGNSWLDNIAKLLAGATAYNNILGENFYSMGAIRYGDYVAKISLAPESPELKALSGVPVDAGEEFSAIRNFVVEFFRRYPAEYTVRAQLCTNLESMPIEDASILWSEEQSPHQPVARIVIPKQEAYSAARRVYADEVLSFTPWHAILAHQPLGSIMRVRQKVYEASSRFRHGENMQSIVEPKDISELPD